MKVERIRHEKDLRNDLMIKLAQEVKNHGKRTLT